MLNMFNVSDFQAAGNTALQFYQKNASITVLTATATFVVTVNNWNDLQRIEQAYLLDPDSFDKNFVNIADDYARTATSLSSTDNSEYALKKIFGSMINIYKAPPALQILLHE